MMETFEIYVFDREMLLRNKLLFDKLPLLFTFKLLQWPYSIKHSLEFCHKLVALMEKSQIATVAGIF